jgi:hypothetical protein
MPRYSVSSYTFLVPIAYGKLETRLRCPSCHSLHAGITDGGEAFCVGCGQTLTVRGQDLFVYVVPGGAPCDDPDRPDDSPDYPTFWYGEGL